MVFSSVISVAFVCFVTLLNAIVTLAVYIRNPKNLNNRIFSLTGMTMNIWTIFMYLSTQPFSSVPNLDYISLLLIRISIFFAVLMSTSFFLLAIIIPEGKITLSTRKLILLLIFNFIVMMLTISPLVFERITLNNNFLTPIPGPLIGVFAGYVLILNIGSWIILLKKLKKYYGIYREQLRYLTFGLLIMQGLTILTILIPTSVFQNSLFVPFAPAYGFIFLFLTAYAMIRHRLLDIRIIVVRSITYIILLVLIVFGYSALFILFSNYLSRARLNIIDLSISTVITAIITLSFQSIRRILEKITDGIFFKDRYDPNILLWNLSRIMASTLDLKQLTKMIVDKMIQSVKINYGLIVLIRNKSIIWTGSSGNTKGRAFKGKDIYDLISKSYNPNNKNEQILIYEELTEPEIKEKMQYNGATVILPLVVRKDLIGGLLFGEKSSGEIYSSEDIDLFKIIAPEVAVAVKNALSFEEIRRFNITLEDEVKKATEKLRHANHRLKELDILKDEFVSIASHELRTPMTAIKSYLWMAINKSPHKLEEPLKKYLDISYKSTERLIRLVNDMLTVSRIERNKIEMKKELFDIFEIVQLVYEELKISAQEKNMEFTLNKGKEDTYQVFGDKEKLREVFQNLVGNALKFTPKKGKITIYVNKDINQVKVAISDTGSGIPKEEISKLFKKFSKIGFSYAKSNKQPGTGLGLYISKQIITLHGGNIGVQSEVGVGSTFTINLPYKEKNGDESKKYD